VNNHGPYEGNERAVASAFRAIKHGVYCQCGWFTGWHWALGTAKATLKAHVRRFERRDGDE